MKTDIYYGDALLTPDANGFVDGNAYQDIDGVQYYHNLVQGCDEWFEQRLGIMTASEMKLVLTPTLKIAANAKEKQHLYELVSQRITGRVPPSYINDEMMMGYSVEVEVRRIYSENRAQVKECGFISTNRLGFIIGYSPDGLVGDDGLVEIKSRRPKYQVETIIADAVPKEYMLQIQTGLLVTGRKWCDFISYSGGLPIFIKRVMPDAEYQEAITKAATDFEARMQEAQRKFNTAAKNMIPTELKDFEEISA